MPRRDDIESILLIGSGPIVIGQGCEFDYSGTQAIRVLRAEGYRVILVNSNPATIMTDPDLADATYIEPITPEVVAAIIEREQPDALLPTLGGQIALNTAMALVENGVLAAHQVEMIGANSDAIDAAEDRGRFKELMEGIGLETTRSRLVDSLDKANRAAADLGFPVMIRPSFILGGGGTGIAYDQRELDQVASAGLAASPRGEVLVEESILGWKEFELEVMRDCSDNAVVVCSIENLDPIGIHTGDSIAVAPVMTLSDVEYQAMRDDALSCLRAIGVDTGGSNVQFAIDPETGRRIIIEMNPRVSRSSALASKATGFPIAKIAAKLAVGYTLDEIPNDITGATPASFEPALDYVVVKIPRFDFAKFPSVAPVLGTSMQSVGEAMAFGRTFAEALQKAIRSLETGRDGLNADRGEAALRDVPDDDLLESILTPSPDRLFQIGELLRRTVSVDELTATGIDPWFLDQIEEIVALRRDLEKSEPDAELARTALRGGFNTGQLAYLWNTEAADVMRRLRNWRVSPTFKTVDTCAAEFEAATPYFYGTWEEEDEAVTGVGRTVIVLGSGPNRIGQGIEFDYCCVHASLALQEAGFDAVMINCNPETVSTDYDTSTRLYFEPLTLDSVLAVIAKEKPEAVIVQLGGQTPLKLARDLAAAGVAIAGTPPDSIDIAEDRERFSRLCATSGVPQPEHGTATSAEEALSVSAEIGYPVLVRPSYVLGGTAMRVVYSESELGEYLAEISTAGLGQPIDIAEEPLLIDRFLEGATEVDVDAIYDGTDLYIGGVMEHVEEAGIHSGDSACVIPPPTLLPNARRHIAEYTEALARGLEVCGLLNIQFAVRDDEVFVLEANPRASRTVPFVSKATGVPLAKIATRVMMGEPLKELHISGLLPGRLQDSQYSAVKEAVLPWNRFPAEDRLLGPEMRSTGEVMGIGSDTGTAYAKALLAAGIRIPQSGTLFLSLKDGDKDAGLATARIFTDLGFRILATAGTAAALVAAGITANHVDKVGEGPWDPLRLIEDGLIDVVINTPQGRRARGDGGLIRRATTRHGIPCITTLQGGHAVALSMRSGQDRLHEVESLQSHYEPTT